jgi:Carboxypeptidase regulatory-like domain/TonB-dependent Receptor Plug Domain
VNTDLHGRFPAPRGVKRPGLYGLLLALAIAGLLPDDAAARQAEASALHGRVIDAATSEAVPGAEVLLRNGHRQTVTDRQGAFRFETLGPGRYVLEIQRVGYRTRVDSVNVLLGISLEVTLGISVEPIELAAIKVVSRSLLLESKGFYQRKAQGFRGVFMDRVAIEDKDPLYVGDLFRNIAGVAVLDGHIIMSQTSTLRERGQGCEPALWLDGIRSGLRNYDYIRPDHIEGIEVYTGGGAPAKYNDLCGTVVIWTRVPVRGR